MGKKQLADLIDLVYPLCGQKTTGILPDPLRTPMVVADVIPKAKAKGKKKRKAKED